jgi:hypothetical protein
MLESGQIWTEGDCTEDTGGKQSEMRRCWGRIERKVGVGLRVRCRKRHTRLVTVSGVKNGRAVGSGLRAAKRGQRRALKELCKTGWW